MFGSEDALIHLDMSEFMERHSVSRLVGAPPGYIGYDDAGQLTEAIRRRPYSIVVFDEIEKAHQEAHNMLLQIMEEGHITDARGRTVDFRNAMIIMTSNIGAELIQNNASIGFDLASDEEQSRKRDYDDMRRKLLKSLKNTFRPEFINRVDSVVVFHCPEQGSYQGNRGPGTEQTPRTIGGKEPPVGNYPGRHRNAGETGLQPRDGRPPATPGDPGKDRKSTFRCGPFRPVQQWRYCAGGSSSWRG